jgi:hypothetical protein
MSKNKTTKNKAHNGVLCAFALIIATVCFGIACDNDPAEEKHDCGEVIYDIDVGKNGEAYLSGYAYGKGNVERGLTIKYSAEGELLWSLLSREYIAEQARYGNGRFHLGGNFGATPGEEAWGPLMTVAVISDDGKFIWGDKHDPGFSDEDRQTVSVVALGLAPDGATLLAAFIGDIYDGSWGLVLYRYSTDGELVAEKEALSFENATIGVGGDVWVTDTAEISKYNDLLEPMWTSDATEINGLYMMEPTENGDLYFASFGPSTGDPWMRVGKLDPTGLLAWSVEIETGDTYQSRIAGDNERVYILTEGTLWGFDLEGNITAEAKVDIYESRYFGTMSVDAVGNLVLAGTDHIGNTDDIFVEKYSPEGDLLWSSVFDSDGEDSGGRLVVDQEGNIILNGLSRASDDEAASCTIKFDSDGNLLWSTTYDVDADFCGVDKEDEEKACGG